MKNHINKKCSVDKKNELVFVLKCFYGLKTAKLANESPNDLIFQVFPLLHFKNIKCSFEPVHFQPKIYINSVSSNWKLHNRYNHTLHAIHQSLLLQCHLPAIKVQMQPKIQPNVDFGTISMRQCIWIIPCLKNREGRQGFLVNVFAQ